MLTRNSRYYAFIVLGGMLLAACGGESEPTATPEFTAVPTLDINQIPVLGEETPPPPVPVELNDPRFPIQPASGEILTDGKRLYDQYCAACHGPNGEGTQPDPWGPGAAPPHDATGHTWHHADQQNFATVWYGRHLDGVMPAFYDRLTPDEIISVLAYIKTWWKADQLAQQIELSQKVVDGISGGK